jgi:LmbE family N-acetylglucosaminyl deacetylase
MGAAGLIALVVSLASVGAALVSAEIVRRRVRAYRHAVPYDVKADYRLRYDRAFGGGLELRAEGDCLVCTAEISEKVDAAFVEVSVNSTFLGGFADPLVELRLENHVLRQTFERGASGKRFVNVTSWVNAGYLCSGARMVLRGKRVTFDGFARLHLLCGSGLPAGRALVLAPHPDDAEIAAFGLLCQRPSWVTTVTIGDNGPSLYGDFFASSAAAFLEKARIRVWDSLSIPLIAGVPADRVANLGYFDGTLKEMYECPLIPVRSLTTGQDDISLFRFNPWDRGVPPQQATWTNLVRDLATMLAEIKPSMIVLPHPVLDPHADHRLTTIACLEAMTQVSLQEGRVLFYVNHLHETEMFPFGENDEFVTLPPIRDDVDYCQSILSLDLSPERQMRKQVAIEAHHDLQSPVRKKVRVRLPAIIRAALLMVYDHLLGLDPGYVRRAARPNELFFSYDYGAAIELLPRLRTLFEESTCHGNKIDA